MTDQAPGAPSQPPLNAPPLNALATSAYIPFLISLAEEAGRYIAAALGQDLAVRYKHLPGGKELSDPVSEIDREVEAIIRTRLAASLPGHDVLGEEMTERPARDAHMLWAVDPIDGTANFINGFPLFSCSIGILRDGLPVAGAVWCSTSHKLMPGVYHAARGERLHFDREPVTPFFNPSVKRRLGGFTHEVPPPPAWSPRHTGSAALECALVAAGLLDVARFDSPNLWDVAGGVPLVLAAGGAIRTRIGGTWVPFERFEPPTPGGDLRLWRRPVVIGRPEAVDALCAAEDEAAA